VGDPVDDKPPQFTEFMPRLPLLDVIHNVNGSSFVGTLASGKFMARAYTRGGVIPPVGTRTGNPEVHGNNEVFFNIFLPSGVRPSGGWPVAWRQKRRGGMCVRGRRRSAGLVGWIGQASRARPPISA
jgi:hypothetical protein